MLFVYYGIAASKENQSSREVNSDKRYITEEYWSEVK